MVEGGGQVAFLRHTTVLENTDGKRREIWARNTLSGDYELLCLDGMNPNKYRNEKISQFTNKNFFQGKERRLETTENAPLVKLKQTRSSPGEEILITKQNCTHLVICSYTLSNFMAVKYQMSSGIKYVY